MRPDQFRQVKPYDAPRDDEAFWPGLRPLGPDCASVKLLFENRPDARDRRY